MAPSDSLVARVSVVRTAAGVSVASRLLSAGSLRLLSPRNHGHAAWVYTSTLGGGLVDGDALDLDIEVGPGAALFMSTQSTTKVFRGASTSSLRARVAGGGLLVLWPSAASCFRGASYVQTTLIEVSEGASVVSLDAWTSGRPAHEPAFTFDALSSSVRIVDARGAPRLSDATRLAHTELADMSERHAFATVLADGPRTTGFPVPAGDRARNEAAPLDRSASLSATHALGGDRFVMRVAAKSARALESNLAEVRAWVVALLGDDPFRRHAWRT